MGTQNQTSYPSIDRPWLKYYSEEAIGSPVPECTVYEYLCRDSRGSQEIALKYMGRNITYGELFANIDIAACAWASAGIQKGDIVAGIAPSLPELVYSFYALNKIGAVSDFFDPRTEAESVYEELVETKAKAVILFDEFIEKYMAVIKKAGIELIVVLSSKDSLPLPLKILLGLKGKKVSDGMNTYQEFVQKRELQHKVVTVSNEPEIPALMEHIGGTTGKPKAVVLSNLNINAVVHQYRIGGSPLAAEHSWLMVAFPFTAYSLICSMHIPLSVGMCCYMCFTMDISKIRKMILKHKINHMANTPVCWETIVSDPKSIAADFSFLIQPIVGADTLDTESEQRINAFLKSHGCGDTISKGYGMTELGSAVSVCIPGKCNKIGSVGIPFVHTDIAIFDTESRQELPYGEQGEICICGPSVMLGYYRNREATEDMIREHGDGKLWVHSGDLGHMDEDGFLFIDGRLKRMLIDHHGFKIFAPTIEAVLSQCPNVEKCCVVGAPDQNYGVGQVAIAYILLRKGTEKDIEPLKRICRENLPEYQMPSEFVFVDEFPYTTAQKVDYRALEERYAAR